MGSDHICDIETEQVIAVDQQESSVHSASVFDSAGRAQEFALVRKANIEIRILRALDRVANRLGLVVQIDPDRRDIVRYEPLERAQYNGPAVNGNEQAWANRLPARQSSCSCRQQGPAPSRREDSFAYKGFHGFEALDQRDARFPPHASGQRDIGQGLLRLFGKIGFVMGRNIDAQQVGYVLVDVSN